ncbi:3365_t:CDS:2 [Funneliformis geosporum]|nr:3365_t:CDS:2 [Funneliformis geosporum]
MGKYYDNATLTLIAMDSEVEGWLSKHTVFMFDDKLVDDVDGYNENDKVELKLHQALKEIKMRKRTEPIDGIYSILGLLPYGKEVEVSYSKSPEQALFDVMKVAVEHGQAEPFSWHEGGIDVDIVTDKPNYRGIRFDENGISLEGASIYIIEEGAKNASIYKLEEGFETDSGLYKKDVKVKPENTKEGNFLAVFDRERFPSKKPFALLVGRTDKKVRIVIGSDSNNQLQEKAEANEVNEWQNQIEFNPSKVREDIIELELSQKELSGSLSLVEFTSLQKLNCSRNKLIELNLSNYSQLIEIGCHDNELFGIKITGLHQLKTLNA